LDHVERSGDEERTYCKCLPGYFARGGQCVLKLPAVDPAFFSSPEQTAFLKAELVRLESRKEKLDEQIEKLNRLREGEGEYLRQMEEMREQLVFDSVGDVLSITASSEFLRSVPGISSNDANQISSTIKLMKAAIDALSYSQAGPDRERAREKALDVTGNCMSLLTKITVPAAKKQALSQMVEVSAEVIKGGANQMTDTLSLRERVVKALDSVASIAGAVYEPLGVPKAVVNTAGAAVVAWKINSDKESIIEALVSSQRAKLAIDQRLAGTEELINFYRVELKKAGQ
jgi:hypothetical protein